MSTCSARGMWARELTGFVGWEAQDRGVEPTTRVLVFGDANLRKAINGKTSRRLRTSLERAQIRCPPRGEHLTMGSRVLELSGLPTSALLAVSAAIAFACFTAFVLVLTRAAQAPAISAVLDLLDDRLTFGCATRAGRGHRRRGKRKRATTRRQHCSKDDASHRSPPWLVLPGVSASRHNWQRLGSQNQCKDGGRFLVSRKIRWGTNCLPGGHSSMVHLPIAARAECNRKQLRPGMERSRWHALSCD